MTVPKHIHTPIDPRIFVFGSNLKGIHGAGAARYAHVHLGAQWGVGEGRTGRAYALPTCVEPGSSLPVHGVEDAVARFLEYAFYNPDTRFFVSEVGCGLAGFTHEQIAPMFLSAPDNCDLPPGWRVVVDAPGKPLKLRLDDPHTRRVWETVQRAKVEVSKWPPWKK